MVDRIKALSPEERAAKVSAMVNFLAKDDVNNANLPTYPTVEEIEASRKALWTRRIEGFLVV